MFHLVNERRSLESKRSLLSLQEYKDGLSAERNFRAPKIYINNDPINSCRSMEKFGQKVKQKENQGLNLKYNILVLVKSESTKRILQRISNSKDMSRGSVIALTF